MTKIPARYNRLLICNGIAAGFSFMVVPVLAMSLLGKLDANKVSLILTTQVIVTRLLPLVLGAFADVFGKKQLIILGMTLQALGLSALAFSSEFVSILLTAVAIGLGNVFYDLAIFVVFSKAQTEHRDKVFVRNNIFQNIGSILGPALGSTLFLYDRSLPFLFSGLALFILLAFLVSTSSMDVALEKDVKQKEEATSERNLPSLLLFSSVMAFWWFILAQVIVTFPLEAARISHNDAWGGYILSFSGFVVVSSSWLIGRYIKEQYSGIMILLGSLFTATVFISIPANDALWWFVLCVALYSIAESFILPASEIYFAKLIGASNQGKQRGVYKGITGLGMVAGTYMGPKLIAINSTWIWICCGAAALLAALLLGFLQVYSSYPITHAWRPRSV